MCGRYVIYDREIREVEQWYFGDRAFEQLPIEPNAYPTKHMPYLKNNPETGETELQKC